LRDRSLREAIATMAFYPVGMQSFVARRVDRLFTSSAVSAHQIERDFGVARERIRMVANGVDTDLFRPDPAMARDPHEELCVGRASDPNKGVATLVEAIAKLAPPVRLTLVDDPHPDNPARLRARGLGIEDRVDVVGRVPVETLVALYRRAALVAVPSLFEGFGLPAAEAMACGTAVITSDAAALVEITADAALHVDARSAKTLAGAMLRLASDDSFRSRLAAAGRERARRFTWLRCATETREVYRTVLGSL
jgi:glycosyltransferase involved in cell wall biosynthesis